MTTKNKILSAVCAVTMVGAGLGCITYANEIPEFAKNLKGKFHNCLSVTDFSEYETLTDSQKEELTDLQTQLKEIMQEEKTIRSEMQEILETAGVEVKPDIKKVMNPREMKELTDEEKAELKAKISLSEEQKTELKENRKFLKGRKGKMLENKVVEEN